MTAVKDGYGFIACDSELHEVFFHFSALSPEIQAIHPGNDTVSLPLCKVALALVSLFSGPSLFCVYVLLLFCRRCCGVCNSA